MDSHNHEPMLPKVEESDLLGLVVEEVIDPQHRVWWKEFASDNQLLAQQVLKRAYFDTQNIDGLTSLELQRIIVDNISFAIRALKAAAVRRAEQPTSEDTPLPTTHSDEAA
jgi:hypothetical protein